MTELRAMAQAMGVKVSFAYPQSKLIKLIRDEVNAKALPQKQTERISVPEGVFHASLRETLKPLIDRGLILSFPTAQHWYMERDGKQDSGHMSMPLQSILRCAEAVCR